MTLHLLDRDLISEALGGQPTLGREIIVYRETGSTNDVVQHLGNSRCAEGVVVFAETQTAGRGRQGRVWHSQEGKGLWFSILLRPSVEIYEDGFLTQLTAVALAETLDAEIKAPNDIYLHGKKIAGILMEARGGANAYCTLGIGLNVFHTQADFPEALKHTATSLELEGFRIETRELLAGKILRALDQLYRNFPKNRIAVKTRYNQRLRSFSTH